MTIDCKSCSEENEENAYSSPLRTPFPSGSKILNALRMVSSGSVPKQCKMFHKHSFNIKKSEKIELCTGN